jgi:hypothetical protein
MERIFDSPRRVRFVAANVAASDTVKGSHIQRNPLSMGALAEPEEWPRVSQSPKEKKRRDCVMTARLTLSGMQQRKLAHSCEVGSYRKNWMRKTAKEIAQEEDAEECFKLLEAHERAAKAKKMAGIRKSARLAKR